MVWLKRDSLSQTAPRLRPTPPGGLAPAQPADLAASDVVARIRERIETGPIAAGAKLPPERALATEFGVGRPALREAIKVLCGLGVLESRHGSGTFVRATESMPEELPRLAQADADELSVLDLLEVRKILEPRAAWLAATRAGEYQLKEIESARLRLEMRDRDWKLIARLDYELHVAIFRGANNPALLRIYEFLMARILGSDREKVRLSPDVERMRKGHRAIVDAILKRQADAAEKAMSDHLHSVGLDFIREAKR